MPDATAATTTPAALAAAPAFDLHDLARIPPDPHPADIPEAAHAWLAHLAAGRIAVSRPPADPAVAATREANDRLFRARAARRAGAPA